MRSGTRKSLKYFNTLLAMAAQEVARRTPRQRRKMRDDLYLITSSNCGWMLYRNRDFLLDLIEGHTKVDRSKVLDPRR